MPNRYHVVLLAFLVTSPAYPQGKGPSPEEGSEKPVDEAKLLVTELSKLGDPVLNQFLPELYWSIRTPLNAHRYQDNPDSRYSTTGLLHLLQNNSVRKELKIDDSQYRDFTRLRDTIQKELNGSIVSRLLEEDAQFDPASLRKEIADLRKSVSTQIEDLFLPAQLSRLKQLAYQSRMSKRSVLEVLTTEPLASELNLSEEQKEDLKKAASEIEAEFAREIAKLKDEATQKLFSKLKSDQRKKLSQILGKSFPYQGNSTNTGFGISKPLPSDKNGRGKGKTKTVPNDSTNQSNGQ